MAKPDSLTIRQLRFLENKIAGQTDVEAARNAGYAESSALNPHKTIWTSEALRKAYKEALDAKGLTADQLFDRLAEMWQADFADIIDEKTGAFMPIHKWPKIWRQMLVSCDVEETFARSKDGKGRNWDKTGEIVKIRVIDRLKLAELIARFRKIDALVGAKAEQVQAPKVTIKAKNLALVLSPEQLQGIKQKLLEQAPAPVS